jgi:hypothetical protein
MQHFKLEREMYMYTTGAEAKSRILLLVLVQSYIAIDHHVFQQQLITD